MSTSVSTLIIAPEIMCIVTSLRQFRAPLQVSFFNVLYGVRRCRFFSLAVTCLLCLCFLPLSTRASSDDSNGAVTIDSLLERSISRGLISGAVVLVGNHRQNTYFVAKERPSEPGDASSLSKDTLFDVASLTKVLATAPAVLKLLEQGKISLTDPLALWFPEFIGSGREDITILNLMTHTSGLRDVPIDDNELFSSIAEKAAFQPGRNRSDRRFHYADINFILLGDLVRRVSTSDLDYFCQKYIFSPLGVKKTMFRPPPFFFSNMAPTLTTENELVIGAVQDFNARKLGGVAGHAGLFASASDIASFARMILNGGFIDGRRVFSEQAIVWMTTPYFYNKGEVARGLGWDIKSPYSAPKGKNFSAMSFGHTGYSGSSLWIDPKRDIFVILLTIRLDYENVRLFNQLRRDVSTLALEMSGV